MAVLGLLLMLLVLVLMVGTGWASWAVLLGVSTLGALAAWAFGDGLQLLSSLPPRITGLLEHDLLQALALYSLAGALLARLSLVDQVYGGLHAGASRLSPRGARGIASMGLGALLAPMNGSVAASLLALSRTSAAASQGSAADAAPRQALMAAAATLGVIVPPSLVLLLLGDAMLRAHIEGLNLARQLQLPLAGANLRVMNTQDLLQSALLPGLLLLLGWIAVAAWMTNKALMTGARPEVGPSLAPDRRTRLVQGWTTALVVIFIVGLLSLVVLGRVRAVEAAATACMALVLWGTLTKRLTRAVWAQVLDDAMALSGALFALLVAATAFSLLLRVLGTDVLVTKFMLGLQGQPGLALAAVLAALLLCAFVLDAFELIFLVVPIVMPPLLAQWADAPWVATLTLLTLQAGFLLPPFGYAVVLARGLMPPRGRLGPLTWALAPYLAWLALVLACTATWPQLTQWLRSSPTTLAAPSQDADAIERQMREMSQPRSERGN